MRAHYFLLLLLVATAAYGQSFEESMSKIESEKEEALFKWRTTNRFNEATMMPLEKAKEFRDLYSKLEQEALQSRINLHEVSCVRNKTHCLTPQQKAIEEAKVRVAVGYLNQKVAWIESNKGATPQEVEVAIKEQDDKRDKDPCLTSGDCSGRDVASEGKQTGGQTPEKKPEEQQGGGAEVVVTTAGAGGGAAVGGGNSGSETEEKPKLSQEEQDKKTAEDALIQEIAELEKAYAEKYPNTETQMSEEAFKARQELEGKKVQLQNNMLNALCEKYPENKQYCDANERAKLGLEAAKNICLAQRQNAYFLSPDRLKRTVITAGNHETEWEALSDPKSCQTLLDKDKEIKTPADNEQESSGNSDEKSPRNYNASTCQWVKDMPRKIVHGPGCTTAGRVSMCTGYVVCEQKVGGGKFVRMSTCAASKCGINDAAACTGDKNYFSTRPEDEANHFVSPKLKQIFSSEQ